MTDEALAIKNLAKRYPPAGSAPALAGLDLVVPKGQFVAVVGKSGSGKTTLFNLIAGLDRATEGSVAVDGVVISGMGEAALSKWRGRQVGLVFQFFQLLPTLSALDNVIAPMEFTGAIPAAERRARARELLKQLGLADHSEKRPAQLSGGQQQRVAIARALANNPALVMADEPTGNLDTASAEIVLRELRRVADAGRTVLMITHDSEAASIADRVVRLEDGRVIEDSLPARAA